MGRKRKEEKAGRNETMQLGNRIQRNKHEGMDEMKE
jgi:hypothetical protein